MKHSFTISALLAIAAAQVDPSKFANDQASVLPPDQFDPTVQPLAYAVTYINNSVYALDQGILAFQDASQIASLNATANAILNVLAQQSTIITNNGPIPENLTALLPLVSNVDDLADWVNTTAYDIIQAKNTLVTACAGPLVFLQANNLNTSAASFINIATNALPQDVQGIPQGDFNIIYAALGSAISAFADQTTLPDSCSSTTTTTTAATSEVTTMTTSTGGAVTTTATGSASGGVTTTGGSGGVYPTTGGSYPTGGYPTGGSYTTGGSTYPTGKTCYRRNKKARAVVREI